MCEGVNEMLYRNCEKYLDKIFSNIEELGKIFDDYKIILYYDKSDDKIGNRSKNPINPYISVENIRFSKFTFPIKCKFYMLFQ